MKMKFVGSGALNMDYFYQVEDLSVLRDLAKGLVPGGEVWGTKDEFLRLREALEKEGRLLAVCGGGSSANTIYALKCWGFETGFVGLVGEDEEGEKILQELEGADLSRIIQTGQSACTLIILDRHLDRAIFVVPHAKEELLASFSFPTAVSEWLHLSSLVSEGGFRFHLALCASHPGPRSLDPGEIYAARGRAALEPLLKGNEVLFMTIQELKRLEGKREEFSAWNRYFVLKKGREGAEIYSAAEKEVVPPSSPPLLVDNTGAGDVFDAGFLAGLALGLSPARAGKLAARLAALSLRDYGRRGFPKREEFSAILDEIRSKE